MARRKNRKSKTRKERTPWFDDLSPQTRQAIGAVFTAALGIFIVFALFDAAGPVGRYTDIALDFLLGAGAWLMPLFCVVYIFVLLNPKDNEEVSTSKW